MPTLREFLSSGGDASAAFMQGMQMWKQQKQSDEDRARQIEKDKADLEYRKALLKAQELEYKLAQDRAAEESKAKAKVVETVGRAKQAPKVTGMMQKAVGGLPMLGAAGGVLEKMLPQLLQQLGNRAQEGMLSSPEMIMNANLGGPATRNMLTDMMAVSNNRQAMAINADKNITITPDLAAQFPRLKSLIGRSMPITELNQWAPQREPASYNQLNMARDDLHKKIYDYTLKTGVRPDQSYIDPDVEDINRIRADLGMKPIKIDAKTLPLNPKIEADIRRTNAYINKLNAEVKNMGRKGGKGGAKGGTKPLTEFQQWQIAMGNTKLARDMFGDDAAFVTSQQRMYFDAMQGDFDMSTPEEKIKMVRQAAVMAKSDLDARKAQEAMMMQQNTGGNTPFMFPMPAGGSNTTIVMPGMGGNPAPGTPPPTTNTGINKQSPEYLLLRTQAVDQVKDILGTMSDEAIRKGLVSAGWTAGVANGILVDAKKTTKKIISKKSTSKPKPKTLPIKSGGKNPSQMSPDEFRKWIKSNPQSGLG